MKNIILLLFVLLNFSSEAQNRKAAMQLRLRDNNLLTIEIDGRRFNKYGYSLTIADLPPGVHQIKVYRFYPANNDRYGRSDRASARLAYNGRINLSPATMYFCTIDAVNRTMSIRESRTISYERGEKSYDFDGKYDVEVEHTDPYDVYGNDNRYDRDRDRERDRVERNRNNEAKTITQKDMDRMQRYVEESIGDDTKRNFMQEYITNKSLNTAQVMTMMSWLNFEATKLKLAKYCYPFVSDKDNYLEVSRELTFQSSKRELESLIFADNKKNANTNKPNPNRPNNINRQNEQLNRTANGTFGQNEINTLHNSVNEKITDTDKQKLMEQYLNNYKYSTAQVAEMMDWLTFEGSKLEFAKWSYSRTTDPKNYFQLKNKFSFISSKKAIDDLVLKGQKR